MNLSDILIRERGQTLQTRMDAETLAEAVLQSYENAEIGDGSYTYDDDRGVAERFMVAGGGPSAWVVFIRIDDELSAHLEYADSQGRVVVALPNYRVEDLYDAFTCDKESRDSR